MLFRQEALDARAERLTGAVSIATPVSWQLIGHGLGLAILALAIFAGFCQFSRIETARGAIIPAGGQRVAELALPSSAIGFAKAGQEVRLMVDAFPSQRFGTLEGRILTIAPSPVGQRTRSGSVVPVYLVRVGLSEEAIAAFGQRQALIPGMTLTARIVTQKQSLLEWLFEPTFAAQRR